MSTLLRSQGFAAFLLLDGAVSLPVYSQSQPEVAPDEVRVYEAVLGLMDHIPKQDPHVTIFGVTLNSKCGEDAYPAPLVNDCTFLWMKPDTAASVERLLHEGGLRVQDSTWTTLNGKMLRAGVCVSRSRLRGSTS